MVDISRKKKVPVKLTNMDGNAFAILGRCSGIMKRSGWTGEEVHAFISEATSVNSYEEMLAVVLKYCEDIEESDEE